MHNDAIIKENLYEDLILDVYIPMNNQNVFREMQTIFSISKTH